MPKYECIVFLLISVFKWGYKLYIVKSLVVKSLKNAFFKCVIIPLHDFGQHLFAGGWFFGLHPGVEIKDDDRHQNNNSYILPVHSFAVVKTVEMYFNTRICETCD